MQHLKGGAVATSNERYVTAEEADAIIAKLPDVRWKLLFGLARYAGLRIPSESHLLNWADVDWEECRLNVRSPKTEHHRGHERRTVPITKKLMKLLQDRFDVAGDGEEKLVTMPGGNVRRTIEAAVKDAGVPAWDDLFRTLRRSWEIEWASEAHPQFAVSKWIGHSLTVSGKHYANAVPDAVFEKLASPRKAHRIRHSKERNRTDSTRTSKPGRPERIQGMTAAPTLATQCRSVLLQKKSGR
jgi:integrase